MNFHSNGKTSNLYNWQPLVQKQILILQGHDQMFAMYDHIHKTVTIELSE